MARLDFVVRPRPKRDLSALDAVLRAFPPDSMSPADRPYLALANLYAEAGQPAVSRRYLALDQQAEPRLWNPPLRGQRAAEATVLESEGKLPEALAGFQEAARLPGAPYCRQCVYYDVGRVFDKMNQRDSALAAYERAVNTQSLGGNTGTDLAPTLRRMGELYEARGEREKAKEYYGRFVALWRDADSDLQPAVQDVKARLAQLAAEPKP